jgi:hypothetical protein
MFLDYIADWENKNLSCSGCGTTDEVKYIITTKPGDWCKACTYCEIRLHCDGGWRDEENEEKEGGNEA